MLSKTKLKELSGYKQQKRCDEEDVFVVEGVKMCNEALAANIPAKVICATNCWLASHTNLPEKAEVFEIDNDMLERLSSMKTPNEVWMLLPRQYETAGNMVCGNVILALDHLQDPGNMGTIIRTADWFGVRHIVCSEGTVSCFNPKVVQATMGGVFRTQVEYTDLPQWLSKCGKPIVGALLTNDSDNVFSTDMRPGNEGVVLVIGNESKGISPEVQQCVTHRVKIPNIGGTAESLNASVACAIMLAEMCKSTL